jgi:hypothetical protein
LDGTGSESYTARAASLALGIAVLPLVTGHLIR